MDEAMASVLLLGGQDDEIQVTPIFIDGHPITLTSLDFIYSFTSTHLILGDFNRGVAEVDQLC